MSVIKGTIVTLKRGGVREMEVTKVQSQINKVLCHWVDDDVEIHDQWFGADEVSEGDS